MFLEKIKRLGEALVKKHLSDHIIVVDDIKAYYIFAQSEGFHTLGTHNRKTKVITLNKSLVLRWPFEKLWRETILHEIAHGKPGSSGHGIVWRMWCIWLGASPYSAVTGKLAAEIQIYEGEQK